MLNIFLIAIVIILLARLLLMKKEIRNMKKQLNEYNNINTNKKIDVSLFDKDIEALASSINNHIDIHIESNIKQKQIEDELKRAISNIAHDIRTPLTSIIGYIQMTNKGNIDEYKKKEYLNIAEGRAKILHSMLNDLFSLSVIQSPEYDLELENMNLNNCLYEVITSYYENLIENNIEPNINIKDEDLIIIGNKNAVCRVLENLITNLIKYSKGSEEIIIEKIDNDAVITIANKLEEGIEPDIEGLFERFYKKDTSRSNVNSTGLGLSIAKNLMKLMNGEINAKIENNKIYIICSWDIFKN